MVAPDIRLLHALLYWADRVFPAVHVVQSVAVGEAAAGETHELWLKVGR